MTRPPNGPLLITGGCGFIVSAVVRLALARGMAVVNLDALTYAGSLSTVAAVSDDPLYTFVEGDIRDPSLLRHVFEEHRPARVLHLAAESHVDRSIDGPAPFLETNVMGTFHLLEAARRHGVVRFHHVSTDEVFGSLGPEGQFTETTPYDPRSPYSASKAASDHLVRAWGTTYDLPVVISNCSNNYGPYQFPEKLIPVVILNALAGRPIPIYGAGQQVRDWLYVDDHAEALLAVLEQGPLGESYNIGGENELSNLELTRRICVLLDEMVPRAAPYSDLITFVADRPGHDPRYAIDPSKMKGTLGWCPSVSLDEGLRRTVRWYLEHRAWWEGLQPRNGLGVRLGLGGSS